MPGALTTRWLLERFASAPERAAFASADGEVTYGRLLEMVEAHAAALEAQGVGAGEIVAVVGDFSPAVFAFLLALAGRGATAIPLTRHAVIEIDAALAVSGCDWLAEFDGDLREVAVRRHPVPLSSALMAEFRAAGRAGLVFFSSGSTGAPKGILHDVGRVASKFQAQRQPAVAIAFLMLDHFGGINTLLAITSSLGTVVTVRERSVEAVCEAVERHRVELLPATPSFLTLLMASGAHRDRDLSSLRRITYGTEVMPQATLDRLRAAFPAVEFQQTYGLSEVGVLRSQSRADGSLWVRIGGGGFETRVVDGILWIRSDYAMVGYLNAPSHFDADGWFNTQDRVEVDGEWVRILGRVTDLINVGGQKVYPAEVEDVILGLPNIRDVAVHGEAHPLLGQVVVAKVATVEPEEGGALKARIRAACRDRLAAYKIPAKVVLAHGEFHSARHKKLRHP